MFESEIKPDGFFIYWLILVTQIEQLLFNGKCDNDDKPQSWMKLI